MFSELHLFALEGNTAKAQSLIDNGEDPNQTDIQGMSPLHKAARHGHHHFCSFLIEKACTASTPSLLRWLHRRVLLLYLISFVVFVVVDYLHFFRTA